MSTSNESTGPVAALMFPPLNKALSEHLLLPVQRVHARGPGRSLPGREPARPLAAEGARPTLRACRADQALGKSVGGGARRVAAPWQQWHPPPSPGMP